MGVAELKLLGPKRDIVRLCFEPHHPFSWSKMSPPAEGFGAVAEWIALDPDGEAFIFRKFDRLAAQILLYQQARILSLEKELEELDKDVANSDNMALKDAARTWEKLVEQSKQISPGQYPAQRRMSLIVEIKQALKEYRGSPPSQTNRECG